MPDLGDQEALRAAVQQHRRLRHRPAYRMHLAEAPTAASRVYVARLELGRLVREQAWERVRGRLVYRNAISLVDEHGEVTARREW